MWFLMFFQADSNSPVWQQLNANYSSSYSYAKNGKFFWYKQQPDTNIHSKFMF